MGLILLGWHGHGAEEGKGQAGMDMELESTGKDQAGPGSQRAGDSPRCAMYPEDRVISGLCSQIPHSSKTGPKNELC